MEVRNFWFDADIDGKATPLASGPRAKDGGMVIFVKQRSNGEVVKAFTVVCSECDGELRTSIFDADGVRLTSCITKR